MSIQRIGKMILGDLNVHRKMIVITSITLAIIFYILPFNLTQSFTAYYLTLFIGGFILSSMAFNDLHNPTKNQQFLMLPCSNADRFFNKWLLSSVVFAFGSLVIYTLISLLSLLLGTLLFHHSVHFLNFSDPDLWHNIGLYIILQSIVLLGSISFKRFSLIKTTLIFVLICIALSLFGLIVGWLFCSGCIVTPSAFHSLFQGVYLTFWVILAPICLYITYLKLTEYELK